MNAWTHRLLRFALLEPCWILALLAALVIVSADLGRRPHDLLPLDRLVEIDGWICRPPRPLPRGVELEVAPLQVTGPSGKVAYPGHLSLFLAGGRGPAGPPLFWGQRIRFRAPLQDPRWFALPGVADFRESAWQHGVLHRVRLKSPLQIESLGRYRAAAFLVPLQIYRKRFISFCQKQLNKQYLIFILSVFLGWSPGRDGATVERLKDLGSLHFFVVSGFHVSLVLGFLDWMARGRRLRLVPLAGLWSYILLTGAGLPAQRAGLCASVAYLLSALGTRGRFLNTVGLAGLILLLLHPASLYAAGFQFSMMALSAIGLMCGRPSKPALALALVDLRQGRVHLKRRSRDRRRRRWRFWLDEKTAFPPAFGARRLAPRLATLVRFSWEVGRTSFFIQLLTLPVSLYHFNRWSWGQWGANLLLTPCFLLFVPTCLVLFLFFWLPIGPWLAWAAARQVDLVLFLLRELAGIAPVAFLPHPRPWQVGLYLATLLACLFLARGRARWLGLLPPLALWGVLHLPASPHGDLRLTMLDVGQGESLHLEYPDGTQALIDTGGSWDPSASDFVGERLVSRYLWENRVRSLFFVLLTHPHADHVRGLRFLDRAFRIDHVWAYESPGFSTRAPLLRISRGATFRIAGVEHQVLHPGMAEHLSTNNRSLVLLLSYGRFRMLLTGDIDSRVESRLAFPAPITVLKVAHHGSRQSTGARFLLRARPRLALISAGRGNRFSHPHPQLLARLKASGISTFDTRHWGTLRLETDGRKCRLLGYSLAERTFRQLWTARLDGSQEDSTSSSVNSGNPKRERTRRPR